MPQAKCGAHTRCSWVGAAALPSGRPEGRHWQALTGSGVGGSICTGGRRAQRRQRPQDGETGVDPERERCGERAGTADVSGWGALNRLWYSAEVARSTAYEQAAQDAYAAMERLLDQVEVAAAQAG